MRSNLLKGLLITVIFICSYYNGFSQTQEVQKVAIIKFAPLVLFEPVGGIQLGVEFPLGQEFSIQAEYAYLPFSWNKDGGINFFQVRKGTNAAAYKLECRYYFTDKNSLSGSDSVFLNKNMRGLYFAIQSQYKDIKAIKSGYVGSPYTYVEDEYYEESKIFKVNIKLGYQVTLKSRFILDSYIGGGYRYFNIERTPFTASGRVHEPAMLGVLKSLPINIAAGVKLGFAL